MSKVWEFYLEKYSLPNLNKYSALWKLG